MSDLKLVQFGNEINVKNSCTISETPVTHLSSILSKTSFLESSRKLHVVSSVRSVANWVPADIDESANQEAPTKNSSDWFTGYPHFADAHGTSNSQSSGYHSASITHSAPPLRCLSLPLDSESVSPRSSKYEAHGSNFGSEKKSTHSKNVPQLKRTQSCEPREWLTKRQRKQRWPRISGIARKSSCESSDSSSSDSNSCPTVTWIPCSNSTDPAKRSSLPSVGELCANGSDDSSSSEAHNPFTRFSLSPSKSDTDSSDDPFHPQYKHEVTEPLCESVVATTVPKYDLSASISIKDSNIKNPSSIPSKKLSKIKFELFHHQSTPTPPDCTVSALSGTPLVRVDRQSPSKIFDARVTTFYAKPELSRCASVPVKSMETVPSTLNTSHHSLLCCDDSCVGGVRPRALPVIDRTSSGLHCVSTDVVADLVRARGKDCNLRYVIVDCRFPYEYEGGHIQGAINIFTHSDLVHEIFNRVPAQRPPGASGPPKLLGEGLARRLAVNMKEPLSAPCELASPGDDDIDLGDIDDGEESWVTEVEEPDKSATTDNIEPGSTNSVDDCEPESSGVAADELSTHTSQKAATNYKLTGDAVDVADTIIEQTTTESDAIDISMVSTHEHPAFVVIFHCEFSSQRAPDLAAFLRSVDRYSNYHRYPFLYFPEIYVMKGGYSAFYGKYPRLCSPQEYVKMFHRDYRGQLKLYRRLTKRVSSACLACIRPQNRGRVGNVDLADEAAAGDHSFGLDFSADPTVPTRPFLFPSPCLGLKDDAPTPSVMQRFLKSDGSDCICKLQSYESDENKENVVTTAALDDTIEIPAELSEYAIDDNGNANDTQTSIESLSNRRSSSDSNPQDKSSDSPLSLAETVVRVGHQVIAATLTSAAPSAEVVEALDKFHRRATLPIPVGLKRANTITSIHPARNVVGQKRPANDPKWNPLPLCDLDNLGTPVSGYHKRANTVDHGTPTAPFEKDFTDQLSEGTPILSVSRLSERQGGIFSMGSPTLDCFIATEASSRSSPRLGVRRSLSASPSTYGVLEKPKRLQF